MGARSNPYRLVFFSGRAGIEPEDQANESSLVKESEKYDDIIQEIILTFSFHLLS